MYLYRPISMLAAIVLLIVQPVQSQAADSAQIFTLTEIWKVAAAYNRQLKLSDLDLKEADIAVLEAKDRLLPEISVGGDFKHNSKFLIYDNGLFSSPENVAVSNFGYGVGYNFNLNLYSGGTEKRTVKMKREQQTRTQYEFDLQKDNVKYTIAVVYCDLYKFLQFRDFISAEITAQKKQLKLIEDLHKNGIVLKSDVLRASVKLSQLQLKLSDTEKKIEIVKQRLNLLMGRREDMPIEIPYQESLAAESHQESDYQDYVDIAVHQSPDYRITLSDVKLEQINIKQVKSTLLPKISLYANYNYTYPQISFYPYSDALWGFGQLGLRLQFSVDNLYKIRHAIQHVRNKADQQKEKANIKKDEITMQVKQAYLQQQQAKESLQVAEENIIRSTETVRVIKNSYLNQQSLLTDLLEAENLLLEAKFDVTTAEVNLKLSQIRLLVIIGLL